jgi:hypothetical protein
MELVLMMQVSDTGKWSTDAYYEVAVSGPYSNILDR